MTPVEFEHILNDVTAALSEAATMGEPCRNPREFEKSVLEALKTSAIGRDISVDPTFHPHAFPDIVANGFGVEVKHTIKDSWLAVGNSVFEGQRDERVSRIYVVFGKMGGMPAVRWARYEDCITHVRISHAPRFVIEMDRSAPLFSHMDIAYDDFSQLSPDLKMRHIRDYSRGRLKPGERLWWLEDADEGQQRSLPAEIRIYMDLPQAEKRRMRAEAAVLCPQICGGSRERTKYYDVSTYLLRVHGVLAPQTRDLFSAGSVGAKLGERGGTYMQRALLDIEPEMRVAVRDLDDELFQEYWRTIAPVASRIPEWLDRADKYATTWKPSNYLFRDY